MTCKEMLKEVQLVGIAKKKVKVAFYNFSSWTCNEDLNNTFRRFPLTRRAKFKWFGPQLQTSYFVRMNVRNERCFYGECRTILAFEAL